MFSLQFISAAGKFSEGGVRVWVRVRWIILSTNEGDLVAELLPSQQFKYRPYQPRTGNITFNWLTEG